MSDTEAVVVVLTPEQLRWTINSIRDLIGRYAQVSKPCPDELHAAYKVLASSAHATKACATQPQSSPSVPDDLIDTTEAAAIADVSTSWLRRRSTRERLGGRQIGGRYVFPRHNVVEYAAERKAGLHK